MQRQEELSFRIAAPPGIGETTILPSGRGDREVPAWQVSTLPHTVPEADITDRACSVPDSRGTWKSPVGWTGDHLLVRGHRMGPLPTLYPYLMRVSRPGLRAGRTQVPAGVRGPGPGVVQAPRESVVWGGAGLRPPDQLEPCPLGPINRFPSLSCCRGRRVISREPGQGRSPPSSPGCSPHSSRSPGRPRSGGGEDAVTWWWVPGPHLPASRGQGLGLTPHHRAEGPPRTGRFCAPPLGPAELRSGSSYTQGWVPWRVSGGLCSGSWGTPLSWQLRTG